MPSNFFAGVRRTAPSSKTALCTFEGGSMKWKMIASDDGSDEGSFWINNESFRDSCPWDSTFSDRSMAAMTVRGESPSRPKPAEREKHGSSSHRIGSFEHSRHGSDSAIA